MENQPVTLTESQLQFFTEKGYLYIPRFMSPEETIELQKWAQEVHDLPRTPDSKWMPYEEINAQGERVLCRTENFVDSHRGFRSLLRGERLSSVVRQLAGEDMVLFKEKINYKLAGSGGFVAHIDANAYTHIKDIKHLAVLVAADEMNMENGGLELVEGSHNMHIPLGEDHCIESSWIAAQKWVPRDLRPGDALIFGSYLAHRSAANTSPRDRRALYATYNRLSEGDLHDEYYENRRRLWPPTHQRVEGEAYKEGQMRYAYGSPMLSVDLKRQLEV